jgi:hypothetical protein
VRLADQIHPTFYKSILQINTIVMSFPTRRDAVFENFKLSNRGAIRRPPSAITWMVALDALKKDGDGDASAVVKTWNSQTAKSNQLLGAKAQAVKNLMDMPRLVKECIVRITADLGWEMGPWSEDALASKRLCVGYTPRSTNKQWNDRQKVTEESALMTVKYLHAEFLKMAAGCRRKFNKVMVEEVAACAALAWNLKAEVQQAVPISDEMIQEGWISRFNDADPAVFTEVSMALHERSDSFTVRSCSTLAALIESHMKVMPVQASSSVSVSSSSVEAAMFELHMSQIQYDLQACRVFKTKMSTFFGALNHVKLDWKLKAFKENRAAVESYISSLLRLEVMESAEDIHRMLNKFKNELLKSFQTSDKSVVLLL